MYTNPGNHQQPGFLITTRAEHGHSIDRECEDVSIYLSMHYIPFRLDHCLYVVMALMAPTRRGPWTTLVQRTSPEVGRVNRYWQSKWQLGRIRTVHVMLPPVSIQNLVLYARLYAFLLISVVQDTDTPLNCHCKARINYHTPQRTPSLCRAISRRFGLVWPTKSPRSTASST